MVVRGGGGGVKVQLSFMYYTHLDKNDSGRNGNGKKEVQTI